MGFYRDIETREILTGEMLKGEFETRKADGTTDAETVGEYIESCLTRNNGTLDPVFTCREFVEDLYFTHILQRISISISLLLLKIGTGISTLTLRLYNS